MVSATATAAALEAPQLRLLDGRRAGLDESGLRDLARRVAAAAGAVHVTRSYSYPYAVVAWHSTPVGVDIEQLDRFDATFAEVVCTPAERAHADCAGDRDAYLSSLWSSKEALSKALGDALRYDPSRLDSPIHWPAGRAGAWRAKRLAAPAGHVGWLCWRASVT